MLDGFPFWIRCDIPTCLLLPTGYDFPAVKGTGGVCVCVSVAKLSRSQPSQHFLSKSAHLHHFYFFSRTRCTSLCRPVFTHHTECAGVRRCRGVTKEQMFLADNGASV